ncbi:NADPH-dependent FMN reductase [Flagellimonas allohymeniacidonis]|uniref:NADPH-dependent oxidoreductase n=1 Tax=Flagellimonas allohymeniacidonis TaxID=2517819 RepID=A0A4Q8QI96_9FLAO|nr:NAD(P)H-dependent oxidoreductase [Allomuricauda hymeniacidonis]TAI48968.1 NADPH-dependent oxidoreductase [Allomuricauda hymeniacidonis]
MAEILALAGSNSSTSINYELIRYTTSLIEGHEIQVLNMAQYPFSMYSEDEERQKGFSNSLIELKNDIQKAKGVVLSVNEHNGNPSAYFKNVIDWLSRLERKFFQDTFVFLMSASRGKRGGVGSLQVLEALLPRFGAEVVTTFSLPSFQENFEKGTIVSSDLQLAHQDALNRFLEKLT